jgi:hypothetical protein
MVSIVRTLTEEGVPDVILEVYKEIRVSVEVLCMSLGINMTKMLIQMLVQDIYEVYKHDSIEDVQQCLRKARLGTYTFAKKNKDGMFEYFKKDVLTFPLVKHWMTLHLDEKAEIRERENIEFRKTNDPANSSLMGEDVTYEQALEYIARMKKMLIDSKIEKVKEENVQVSSADKLNGILKIINSNDDTREVHNRIVVKMNAGKAITDQEKDWLIQWKLYQE